MTKLTKLQKGLLGTVALGFFSVGTSFAQTAAETPVDNTFTLNYEVNGAEQPEINNNGTPTRFLVDRLIDLTVENVGGNTTVVSGQTNAETTFTLTNDGNGTQAYFLDVFNGVITTDDFNPSNGTPIITYVQGGVTVTFDPTDTSTFPILAPDATIQITVNQNIGTGLADGAEGQIILRADTLDSTSFTEETADVDGNDLLASENVLADEQSIPTLESAPGVLVDGDDAGDDAAIGTYIVAAANVTGVKTVSIFSEDGTGCGTIAATLPATTNTEYSVPGACVEYRITVTNNDTREATAISIGDTLPAELDLVTAELRGPTSFTGGTLAFPTIPVAGFLVCNATNCEVNLTGASLPADDGVTPDNNNSPTGVVVIRALLK